MKVVSELAQDRLLRVSSIKTDLESLLHRTRWIKDWVKASSDRAQDRLAKWCPDIAPLFVQPDKGITPGVGYKMVQSHLA